MSTISIIKIKEDEFVFRGYDLEKIDSENLYLEYNRKFGWSEENNIFKTKFGVSYYYKLNNEDVELIKFSITVDFNISNLKEILTQDDNGFELPDELLLTMISSTVGATRALLSAKVAGTILASFYMPLVDANLFLDAPDNKVKKTKPLKLI